jgi:hypothetical protein
MIGLVRIETSENVFLDCLSFCCAHLRYAARRLDQSIIGEMAMSMIRSLCLALILAISSSCFFFVVPVHSHSLGFHGLDGEPPNSPVLPEIRGPFEIELTFIVRSIAGLWYQRLIDYSNPGDVTDLVGIGQETNSSNLFFEVLTPTVYYKVQSTTEFVVGQVSTVLAGVNATGHLWMTLNNGPLFVGTVVMSTSELVHLNKVRTLKRLGSPSVANDDPLDGAVLGVRITSATNGGTISRIGIEQNRFRNLPAQAFGPFTVSFWARFDNPVARINQIVFDFGNGPNTNNIYMGSFGASRTSMAFGIYQNGAWTRITLPNSIVTNEVALWHAGLDSDGTMWIQKNSGNSLATSQQSTNTVVATYTGTWRNEIRSQLRFGSPQPGGTFGNILDGFVLGFQLDAHGTS